MSLLLVAGSDLSGLKIEERLLFLFLDARKPLVCVCVDEYSSIFGAVPYVSVVVVLDQVM
jgi:hypothetical protein